jgi:hypothetical protein
MTDLMHKAGPGAGVEAAAEHVIEVYPELTCEQQAALVRKQFHERGEPCACTAACIRWYRARMRKREHQYDENRADAYVPLSWRRARSRLIRLPGASRPLLTRFATRGEAERYAMSRYPMLVWDLISSAAQATHTFALGELQVRGKP